MIKREKISVDTNSNHEKFDLSVNKFDSIRGVLLWYFLTLLSLNLGFLN
jgi:hypothetical protein